MSLRRFNTWVAKLAAVYNDETARRLDAMSDEALYRLIGPRANEYMETLTPDELVAMAEGPLDVARDMVKDYRQWYARQA